MNRRRFLGGATATAAMLAWPGFLRRAFGDATCDLPAPPLTVGAAWRRAVRSRRPLLVLVIPQNDVEKDDRGHAFGEFLNHAGDAELAPLARAVVVCATMDDVRRLVPSAGDGEPLVVLIGTDRQPPPVQRLYAKLPSWESSMLGDHNWADLERASDAAITRRTALLADWIGARLPVEPARVAVLAAEARRTLRLSPPPGARWANSSGCGMQIEGEADNGIDCGMGHVPARSQRFLYFFARSNL
jgi:hypothetical protein